MDSNQIIKDLTELSQKISILQLKAYDNYTKYSDLIDLGEKQGYQECDKLVNELLFKYKLSE